MTGAVPSKQVSSSSVSLVKGVVGCCQELQFVSISLMTANNHPWTSSSSSSHINTQNTTPAKYDWHYHSSSDSSRRNCCWSIPSSVDNVPELTLDEAGRLRRNHGWERFWEEQSCLANDLASNENSIWQLEILSLLLVRSRWKRQNCSVTWSVWNNFIVSTRRFLHTLSGSLAKILFLPFG